MNDQGLSTDPIRHIYVHIPFCARICPYCAFYKEQMDASRIQTFCQAVLGELKNYSETANVAPETIFFGGGTPTALSSNHLRMLLEGFRRYLDLSSLAEFTIEANPGSVSARKAAVLMELGVTRISMGVQSWDDDLLQFLGREHNAQQAEESFRILRTAGSGNINIDLMFGLPGQTQAQWRASLARTIALQPEHISAYCLTYEEDTDFFLRHARGELVSNSDTEAELFEIAMAMLEDAGYQHYEISNYAQPGFQSRHNHAYWSGNNYLGIGPSAFSTVDMRRWQNVADYRAYTDRILNGQSAVASSERLTPSMKRTERIGLCLRTDQGIADALVENNNTARDEFLELGLIESHHGNLVLTRRGKCMADEIAAALI